MIHLRDVARHCVRSCEVQSHVARTIVVVLAFAGVQPDVVLAAADADPVDVREA